MTIEYRVTIANDSYLRQLGIEGWRMCGISEGKFYFMREKSAKRETVEKPKTLEALTELLEGSGQLFDQLSERVEPETLKDFAGYWLEKGEGEKKHRFQKQSTFDISRRLATWTKRDNNHYNTPKIGKL